MIGFLTPVSVLMAAVTMVYRQNNEGHREIVHRHESKNKPNYTLYIDPWSELKEKYKDKYTDKVFMERLLYPYHCSCKYKDTDCLIKRFCFDCMSTEMMIQLSLGG
jgi:hypothetical protein